MSPALRTEYQTAATLPRAIILGCAGLELSDAERRFFRSFDPLGFILFQRNCDNPKQVRALTSDLRNCVGRQDAPILIDQEGGRVARLKPPHWPKFPPMQVFGEMLERLRGTDGHFNSTLPGVEIALEACELNHWLIAHELTQLGITVNCAPVADLRVPGAHDVIGDRAFGSDPEIVKLLARSAITGLHSGGVVPVLKHIPGHGRASSDSHFELPVVAAKRSELEETDFVPFRYNLSANDPWAMVAHVKYPEIDPQKPASISRTIIDDVIRIGMGFSGVLIADDIGMSALTGTLAERAKATLAAGNDVTLHCSGKLEEMETLVFDVRTLTPDSYARLTQSASVPELIRAAQSLQSTAEEAATKRARLRELISGVWEMAA